MSLTTPKLISSAPALPRAGASLCPHSDRRGSVRDSRSSRTAGHVGSGSSHRSGDRERRPGGHRSRHGRLGDSAHLFRRRVSLMSTHLHHRSERHPRPSEMGSRRRSRVVAEWRSIVEVQLCALFVQAWRNRRPVMPPGVVPKALRRLNRGHASQRPLPRTPSCDLTRATNVPTPTREGDVVSRAPGDVRRRLFGDVTFRYEGPWWSRVTLRVMSIRRMDCATGILPGTEYDRRLSMRTSPSNKTYKPLLSVEETANLLGEDALHALPSGQGRNAPTSRFPHRVPYQDSTACCRESDRRQGSAACGSAAAAAAAGVILRLNRDRTR